MKLRLLRNATLKLEFLGRTILIDPFLAPKGTRPTLAGRAPNPLVDLPVSAEEILKGVELVIVSHLHSDHFDPVAQALVPKHLPLICQPGDEVKICAYGFSDVTPLTDSIDWQSIRLERREGSHGLGPVVDKMGSVMGFSIAAKDEPVVYWAGDTVLYPPVAKIIDETRPDVVIIHPCGARWGDDLIAMDAEQAIAVCRLASNAVVVATHLEALDHTTVTRADLRRYARERGIPTEQLLIPEDGVVLEFG
ncbi:MULTISPECIES: MBL fold metallo-hydrolase [Bradyrhizobium]|jgi:L-ascorbate metabolism protein UlaG (beta-lactamase superfamily)|uniref:MBL fold metallo-hydrolase n=1 Tax=Bradyrhizobium TaxID=374 RepID=UPI0004861FD9|nr:MULTISPECIES: MBL fold metallo-hydrolase [Bradyrhizobium]MCS3451200.1 L-ascorbate metabolism protein UlaG (beta-lactamase superfamily) [Bradyrhizobium elkanii]MCS3566777.1 L-ascorbate metabolism protein UlaG (beta-lactamase superfamily) [Bradyrhizobium elkanii]MCW2152499.1 L-ascorbate metabolism protein UlaG (beta-lactamase superfamily) [Bradyrhizobium elkanii]MCW2357624.1 L-ascorbate metabolism protein UlaG (beta-lactamase superfamily) [Bradyrhizobium elkanii]MCW2376229.1 L-ascorbate metab